MTTQIRILAVDDHALLRKGIAAILASQPDMSLVAEASNGREAVDQYRTHHPDITLMDVQMPTMNGLDAMVTILGEAPHARIIVLTTYVGDVQILRAMKAGARGYLLKTLLDKELLETIRAVHTGRKMLSAEASYELAEYATSDALTPAELEVLRLIVSAQPNKEIAARLSVTEDSVKGRVKNVLSKLGATDRTHAAMIAVKRGFIEPLAKLAGIDTHREAEARKFPKK